MRRQRKFEELRECCKMRQKRVSQPTLGNSMPPLVLSALHLRAGGSFGARGKGNEFCAENEGKRGKTSSHQLQTKLP